MTIRKTRHTFTRNIHIPFLAGVLALGLITIIGSGGGSGGSAKSASEAAITFPADGAVYIQGYAITLSGTGQDSWGNDMPGNDLVWTSSLDGQIGTGASLSENELSLGSHTITLTATGTEGTTAFDSINLEIIEEGRYVVENYDPAKANQGTTFFTDGSDSSNFKVVEVDMNGNIVWQYTLAPEMVSQNGIVGFEAELLANGNILMPLSGSGIFEIDRAGSQVWTHPDPKVSHDADLLADNTILYNFGNNDTAEDAAVKITDRDGNIQWEWYLSDYFLTRFPQPEYVEGGWGHCNAVQRLSNGTTLVSIRNFDLTVIVDNQGDIVREYDWSNYGKCYPHEPQIYENDGVMIVCLQADSPYAVVTIDIETEAVLWTYPADGLRTTRDANILSNGNVLLTTVETGGTDNTKEDDVSTLIEVAPDGEIVWQLRLMGIPVVDQPGWFFKADRLAP